jgi:hypothetical protein
MNILSLIKKPASTAAELRAKLEKLAAEDPLARRPQLETARRAALLAGDDNEATRLDAELLATERDAERRELAIAELEQQLEAAEANERAAEVDKLTRAAKAAAKKIDAALAEYREGAMKVLGALEAIAKIEETISKANAALPADQQLPSAEMAVRGLPAEPREQLSRRGVGERWYTDGGAPVAERDVGTIKSDDGRTGTLEVHDRETGLTRQAPVVKRRLVETTHLEHRPAYQPFALHGSVSLPGILPGHADFWNPTDAEVVLAKVSELKALLPKQQPEDPRAPRHNFSHVVVEVLP